MHDIVFINPGFLELSLPDSTTLTLLTSRGKKKITTKLRFIHQVDE